jgi:hypothetical protein
MSPHCQVTPPNCQLHIAKSPTPFHPLEQQNTLQTAQNNFFTGCPMPEIYSFSAQIYAQKRRSFNFHLPTNSKKLSIVFFLIVGVNSDSSFFFFLPLLEFFSPYFQKN